MLDHVDEDVFDGPVRRDLAATYLQDPRNLLAVAIENGIVVGMASAIAYVHPDKPLQLFAAPSTLPFGPSRTTRRLSSAPGRCDA